MRLVIGVAALLLAAGAAQAQTVRPLPSQSLGALDATRLEQQRLGDQLQVQALTAAQAQLRTQQTLQGLEFARPLAPIVPENYPGTSSVRRRQPTEPQNRTAPTASEPASAGLPADAATRGDLPL